MTTPFSVRSLTIAFSVVLAAHDANLSGAPLSDIQVEVFRGAPVGVGRLSFAIADQETARLLSVDGCFLREVNHRVLFPVFSQRRPILEYLARGDAARLPRQCEVLFLFHGDPPLEITLASAGETRLVASPVARPRAHQRSLKRWWRALQAATRSSEDELGHAVDVYLAATLGRQLGMSRARVRVQTWQPRQALELLTGSEHFRRRTFATFAGDGWRDNRAIMALPSPAPWSAALVPDTPDVRIAPLAEVVPDDCWYASFGRFSNYLWLSKLLEEQAAQPTGIMGPRGHDARLGDRVKDQLAVRDLPFAELLGDAIIDDIALIGADAFMQDGAAIGVVIQSSNPVFRAGFEQVRSAVLEEFSESMAKMESVEIRGREVSFLSTPDNRLRSYFVNKKPFYLVTNCKAIVEKFLDIENGNGSLAKNAEYRYARHLQAANAKDSIFVFVPRLCWQRLAGPHYQIELWRRMRAAAEIEILQLASLTHQAQRQAGWIEGPALDSLAQSASVAALENAGLLPGGVGQRPEGGRIHERQGELVDSLRGARHTFLPIPDMTVGAITATELNHYQQFDAYLRRHTPSLAPMSATIQRSSRDDTGSERIEFHVRLAPFDRTKYHLLTTFVGEATTEYMLAPADSVASLHLVSSGLATRYLSANKQTMFALLDRPPADVSEQSLIRLLGQLRAMPLLCVTTFDGPLLNARFGLMPQAANQHGITRLPLGVWRRAGPELNALSFQRELIESLPGEFPLIDADNEAQIRLRVSNLASTQLEPWLNNLARQRALDSSRGNVRLLHRMTQQFGIPSAEARTTTESLLGTQLVSPLGGEFELVVNDRPSSRWRSTAWQGVSPVAADAQSVVAPLVTWLRGAHADVALDEDRMRIDGFVDIQRAQPPPKKRPSLLPKLF